MVEPKNETEQKTNGEIKATASNRNHEMKLLASLSFRVGCLTVILAGLALLAGLWLDARQGTVPKWTLIFLLGSVPLTIGVLFWQVRRMLKSRRAGVNQDEPTHPTPEDNDQ